MNSNEFLRTMSSPTSFAILGELVRGDRCACELPALIGKTQSNTSMHLAKLLDSGLVRVERDGRKMIYSVCDARVEKVFEVIE